ncbi:hypothetical protein U0070_021934 [Myodes glareolus]|uniref:Uncharacterized protein n=1 Tax=Myodes glareolus TaxID=447135 RepID=A0AAW0HX40_MYOGA
MYLSLQLQSEVSKEENSVSCEVYLVMKGQKSELDGPAVVELSVSTLRTALGPSVHQGKKKREGRGKKGERGREGNSSATVFARPNFDAVVKLEDEGLGAFEFDLS